VINNYSATANMMIENQKHSNHLDLNKERGTTMYKVCQRAAGTRNVKGLG